MTQQPRQIVLDILTGSIRDDYREAAPDLRNLPLQAIDCATPESLQAFVEIHEALCQLVSPNHIRTRYIGVRTSTGGYGLAYYQAPITSKVTNRTNKEIQAVLLPIKPRWRGFLEVYYSGHDEKPVESTDIEAVGTRAGKPVFHVRSTPSPQFVRQTIDAFRRSSLL